MHLRLPGRWSAPGHWPAGDLRALLRVLTGFALAGLVILGVGGTVYHFIAPGGLLAQLFSRSAAGGMAALLAFFFIGVSGWMLRASIPARERPRMRELLSYPLALAGLVYAAQFIVKGPA
jgi:hypothetical protein